jgi:hypothetical protein
MVHNKSKKHIYSSSSSASTGAVGPHRNGKEERVYPPIRRRSRSSIVVTSSSSSPSYAASSKPPTQTRSDCDHCWYCCRARLFDAFVSILTYSESSLWLCAPGYPPALALALALGPNPGDIGSVESFFTPINASPKICNATALNSSFPLETLGSLNILSQTSRRIDSISSFAPWVWCQPFNLHRRRKSE